MPKATPEIRYTLPPAERAGRMAGKTRFDPKAAGPPLPRLTRLMALAIHLDRLARSEDLDFADLAQWGGVARSRITQIFNLLHLAPDLQERLLFLERGAHGRDPLTESAIRRLSSIYDWQRQRRSFEQILHARREKAGR